MASSLSKVRRTAVILSAVLIITILSACRSGEKRVFRIGVSQCSEDIWREKQNAELRMGAYIHGNVDLHFAVALDDDQRQCRQIDSLSALGIDLLIVCPNQTRTVSPAIDRAFRSGIPVIVFERKAQSDQFTAFIGADNYEMGQVMGFYIAQRSGGKGRIIEVMGLSGSSPAQDRHKGFCDAIARYPGLHLIATLQGDWTEESAYEAACQWKEEHREDLAGGIDYVFGQNDRMALGARRAFLDTTPSAPIKYLGIDGLPGADGGIALVCNSVLDATYIYPTHGDQLIELALAILKGKPYAKETKLKSALVTPANASALKIQEEEIMRQSAYLEKLHAKADTYLKQLATQRAALILGGSVVLLLLLVLVLLHLYNKGRITLHRQRSVSNLWNLPPQESTHSANAIRPETQGDEGNQQPELPHDNPGQTFIAQFKKVVEERMGDSDLSVEDLAAAMNLSRVQLYRKVKAITGGSPIELLRTARLNRAYQMVLTTDKTISEVAYAVGFSSPSYFTKCYKDEFGQSPTDLRSNLALWQKDEDK